MDKILAINTIKNVFSALGAKTSDSNYGVALLDKTSGEPKGLMGMSDLASVLGAVKTGSGDANTIDDEWHMCSNNVSNVPTTYGLLHTKKYSDALFMQEYFSTVDKQSYTRTYYSGQWHDWTSLNSFGCSTPADLASLLGGMRMINTNLNNVLNISNVGCYITTTSCQEAPGMGKVYYILSLYSNMSDENFLIAFGLTDHHLYTTFKPASATSVTWDQML